MTTEQPATHDAFLIAPEDGEGSLLALACGPMGSEHPQPPLIVLGGESAADHARQIGFRVDAAVPPVAGRWHGAGRALARACRSNGWTQLRPVGRVASEIAGRAVRADAALRVAEHPVERIPEQQIRSLAGRLSADRSETRRGLALQPGDRVIVPLADDPRTIDATRFAFLLGVLDLMGRPLVAVIPAAARNIPGAFRFVQSAKLSLRLLVADAPLIRLATLADIALTDLAMTPGDRVIECDDSRRLLHGWVEACGAQVEGDPRTSAPKRPIPEVTHTLRWASAPAHQTTP